MTTSFWSSPTSSAVAYHVGVRLFLVAEAGAVDVVGVDAADEVLAADVVITNRYGYSSRTVFS